MKFKLAGESWDIAPYKLDQLEEAAPHLDALGALGKPDGDGKVTPPEGMVGVVKLQRHIIGVLLPGMRKQRPETTAEWVMQNADLGELLELRSSIPQMQREAGFESGELKGDSPQTEPGQTTEAP